MNKECLLWGCKVHFLAFSSTPKRIELLHLIREKHPKSIQELARIAKRDIKSIVTDIAILAELGLIDIKRKKDGRKESMPENLNITGLFVGFYVVETKHLFARIQDCIQSNISKRFAPTDTECRDSFPGVGFDPVLHEFVSGCLFASIWAD